MKIRLISFIIIVASLNIAKAQYEEIPEERLSCTSITVGKKATTDGSVITSHTCDGNYRAWIDIVKRQKASKDTIAEVYEGRMHTDHSQGARGMKLKGTVPLKAETYSFVNTAYPCLNEKQLGIGETTIGGRKELVNTEGMFYIEELERLALQQCTTARDAIRLMGDLATTYGYADSGECLTIADKNEVWQFEIFGSGPGKASAVWAAQRIPDNQVGVSANISRISEIDLNNPDYFMASANVKEVAKKMKLWDGKEPFKFWKAYAGMNYFKEPKNFSIREFFLLNKIAPKQMTGYKFDDEELPFSVVPEKNLSAQDVMELLTETYEGTEYDMTRNLKITKKNKTTGEVDTLISPVANPWMTTDTRNMLNGLQKDAVSNWRTVSVPQCAYSTVIQLRDWLPDDIGGVAWIAFDNPGQSPRIPVFSGTQDLPDCFKVDGQNRFDENSALWRFRKGNKLATVKYGLTKDEMKSARKRFVEKGVTELPFVENRYNEIMNTEGEEAARKFLTDYTAEFVGAAILRWDELAKKYWTQFSRGF